MKVLGLLLVTAGIIFTYAGVTGKALSTIMPWLSSVGSAEVTPNYTSPALLPRLGTIPK